MNYPIHIITDLHLSLRRWMS